MDLIKLKLAFKKMKIQDTDWEKISARHITKEKALSKILKSCTSQ